MEAVVAGHVCIDIIPTMKARSGGPESLFVPGSLLAVGPAVISTGGSVSNTGLALRKLGVDVGLMGKIGDDVLGKTILDILSEHAPDAIGNMIISEGEYSSYTLVISPPGVDRMFIHCPGTNDTFVADDIDFGKLKGSKLFHFGYPPLMRGFYSDSGDALKSVFSRAKEQGLTTSLDLSLPDLESDAGRAPWRGILEKTLPNVDIFLPSIEEIFFMVDLAGYTAAREKAGTGNIIAGVDGELLHRLSGELLEMGVAVAGIKLGDQGFYVRTTSDQERLAGIGPAAPVRVQAWVGKELLSPVFQVEVAGTTGAGDSTIAGFLAGLLKGLDLEDVLTAASAVGACSVERPEAVTGIPLWDTMQKRIRNGWARQNTSVPLPKWNYDEKKGIWRGQ